MNGQETSRADDYNFSQIIVPLLKGVLYQESHPDLWEVLIKLQAQVRDYIAVLGLDLRLDEAEGYAFLHSQIDEDDELSSRRPRLVARRALSFPVSLLLALFRKKLAEFDSGGGDTRLVLSRDEVVELIRVFLPEGSNETRLIDHVDTYLNKIAEMGFVRPLREQKNMFEVKRIIKAFVDAQWLADFEERLTTYRTHLSDRQGDTTDE